MGATKCWTSATTVRAKLNFEPLPDGLLAYRPDQREIGWVGALRVALGQLRLPRDNHRSIDFVVPGGRPHVTRDYVLARDTLEQRHCSICSRLLNRRVNKCQDRRPTAIATAGTRHAVPQLRFATARSSNQRLDWEPSCREPRLQRISEGDVCELRLVVALQTCRKRVAAEGTRGVSLEKLFVQEGALTGQAAVRHDAGLTAIPRRDLQGGHEFLHKEKVREMIRLHLHIEALLGDFIGEHHDACVADEHIEACRRERRPKLAVEGRPHRTHTLEALQVARHRHKKACRTGRPELLLCRRRSLGVAIEQNHLCALLRTN
mmetsp:Transcript_33704/g.93081  ORF Transcript_33704/g.93081 Transcript_33704/m.93081 type:complete len:319 (+) Transcript_33704:129-1085(+)